MLRKKSQICKVKSDMKNITITRMTDDDVAEIAELEKKCFAVPWSENLFATKCKTNLRCILSQRITVSVSAMQGFLERVG